MSRIVRGLNAVRAGWLVLWRNGQMLVLLLGALVPGGIAIAGLVLAGQGSGSLGRPGAVAIGFAAAVTLLPLVLRGAVHRGQPGSCGLTSEHQNRVENIVRADPPGGDLGLGHGGRTRAAAYPNPGRFAFGVPHLLPLLWDTATFLVLPALVLDPVSRGRLSRATDVSSRGFVASLVVVVAIRLVAAAATVTAWEARGIFAPGPAGTALRALGVIAVGVGAMVLVVWQLAARVAAYKSTEIPVTPADSGVVAAW